MMTTHLTMEQLLAVRDGDRSEPALAEAHRHAASCLACSAELERLHQRTARLRALPTMAPERNHFPAVRGRVRLERKQSRLRTFAAVGLAAAAMLAVTVIGRDLLDPPRLDAEDQIATAMNSSQRLERTLTDIKPDARVIDGRTAQVVIQLEDRIADLDQQLADAARLQRELRLQREVQLWQQRVGLMNALVDVHYAKASNVGL